MTDSNKLLEKVNEDLGGSVLGKGSDEIYKNTTIPSGVVEFDMKLNGGWSTGCLNILYGPGSSGKSLLSLMSIANAQKICRHCYSLFSEKHKCECGKKVPCKTLYIDAEGSWTNKWSVNMGIKTEDVIVGRPRHMQEAFNIIDAFIREEAVDLIVLDSVAALCPKEEVEATMEEWQTGLIPRVYTKFLRKWATELQTLRSEGKRLPANIFINQIRMKVGVMYGNPETMPGGEAQRFFGSTIIRVTKKGIEMSKDKQEPLYQNVRFVVEKSKVSPVRREGELQIPINNYIDESGDLVKVGRVDNIKALMSYARRFEVISGKTGEYTAVGKKFKMLEEMEASLKEDTSFFWQVFKASSKAYEDYVPHATSVSPRRLDDKINNRTANE